MKELEYPFDGKFILRKKKAIRKQLLQSDMPREKVRIAVLGGSTTADIVSVLELFLLHAGLEPEWYESAYGRYWEDAMFENPELDRFRPEIAVVHTSVRNIRRWPEVQDTEDGITDKIKAEYRHLESTWKALKERYHCVIIQNNYEYPLSGTLGNLDVSAAHGYVNYVNRLNDRIYQYRKEDSRFYIHDVAGLAAEYGLKRWQDLRAWYLYKYSVPMEAIPEFSWHLSVVILAIYGKSRKVLVLDADNTLWGGVIGECGMDGINIGNETAKGQAYSEWQSYIKRLRLRGVILAIVSKNEMTAVMEGLAHPDSILRADDFSAVVANWEDKASNLRALSRQLNIGLQSMVFVDDNPAERELVRLELPEVFVLEGEEPWQFIEGLHNAHLFESVRITEEDMNRTQMYAADRKRDAEKQKFVDYERYLSGLEMRAEIAPFQPLYYARIAQLINKTNQFNLTAWRLTEEEVAEYAGDEQWLCLYGKLEDKFGSNGIVSILMAEITGGSAHVRQLLLSCRVLKRQMEYAMMDSLTERCKGAGVKKIRGYYHPTRKNEITKNFYPDTGFQLIKMDQDGKSVWELQIGEYQSQNHTITVEAG